tara:strand:- start:2337 stop:2513 length:177 start_codon:yes stop_codon:yes gene_type:complete
MLENEDLVFSVSTCSFIIVEENLLTEKINYGELATTKGGSAGNDRTSNHLNLVPSEFL